MAKVKPNEAEFLQWLQDRFFFGTLQLDRTNVAGMNHVHYAALRGFLTVLKWLCKHGASLKQRSVEGSVAAHYAAAGGHKDCLRWICKRSPKTATWKDKHGATPLYFAAQEGHLECLKWLAKHSGPASNHVSSDGMTAVHSAAQEGHLECLRFLVESAECDPSAKDQAGCTPLHFAAAGGHRICVHWLLENFYAHSRSADEQSSTRSTPLHVAADQGHLEVVKLLVTFGASLKQRDSAGRTPYEMAVYGGNEACAGWLAKVEAMQEEDYTNLLEKEKSSKKKVRFERKAVWKDFRQSNFSLQFSPRTTNREMPAARPRSQTHPTPEKSPIKPSEHKKKRPQSFSHRRPRSASGISFRRWTSVDLSLQRKPRSSSRHGKRDQALAKYTTYSSDFLQTNFYNTTSESGSDSDYSLSAGALRSSLSIVSRGDRSSSDNESERNNQGYRASSTVRSRPGNRLTHSSPEIYHSSHDWNIFRKLYRFSKRKLSRSSSFTIQNDQTTEGSDVVLSSFRHRQDINVQVHDRFTLLNRYSLEPKAKVEVKTNESKKYIAGQHGPPGAILDGKDDKLRENAMIW